MSEASRESGDTVFLWSSGGIRRSLEESRPVRAPRRRKARPPTSRVVESRRYPRLDLKLPILYRVVGDDLSRLPAAVRPALLAQTRDISPIGLCLSLAETLRPGDVLALTLHLMEQREKVEALARVVWCRPAGDSVHTLTGLQFVVTEEGKVREALHSRVEAMIRLLEG
jgi:hypothetical protein